MKFDLTPEQRDSTYQIFYNEYGSQLINSVAECIKENKKLTPEQLSELVRILRDVLSNPVDWYTKEVIQVCKTLFDQFKAQGPLSKKDEIKNLLRDMLKSSYGDDEKALKEEYWGISYKDVEAFIKNA